MEFHNLRVLERFLDRTEIIAYSGQQADLSAGERSKGIIVVGYLMPVPFSLLGIYLKTCQDMENDRIGHFPFSLDYGVEFGNQPFRIPEGIQAVNNSFTDQLHVSTSLS